MRSERASANEREDAAEVGCVVECVYGEDGRSGAGEERDLKATALGVGDDPLRGLGPAEGIFVEEALVGGNLDAEDISAASGAVWVKESQSFLSLERTDLSNGEGSEVDADLQRGENDIAGNGACVGAGGAPWSVLLRGGGDSEGEDGEEGCDEQRARTHRLRMTSAERCGKRERGR